MYHVNKEIELFLHKCIISEQELKELLSEWRVRYDNNTYSCYKRPKRYGLCADVEIDKETEVHAFIPRQNIVEPDDPMQTKFYSGSFFQYTVADNFILTLRLPKNGSRTYFKYFLKKIEDSFDQEFKQPFLISTVPYKSITFEEIYTWLEDEENIFWENPDTLDFEVDIDANPA